MEIKEYEIKYNLPKLEGSFKQIEWAGQIRAHFFGKDFADIDQFLPENILKIANDGLKNENLSQHHEAMTKTKDFVEKILAETSAKVFIEEYRNERLTKDFLRTKLFPNYNKQ